jgi:hypothetical protein
MALVKGVVVSSFVSLFHSLSIQILWEGLLPLYFKPFLVSFLGDMQFFFFLAVLALFAGQGGRLAFWKGGENL